MLIQVSEFCDRVESDLAGLADELQQLTGRYGEQERAAWLRSLPKLSIALAKPELEPLHLHIGNSAGLSLEYRLPASSAWCDVVLLGRNHETPSVLIVEMKDWDIKGDAAGPREGLITHKGSLYLHPSDQVKGYVEYCRRFHETVHDTKATVNGCVYFTKDSAADAYRQAPHGDLVKHFPVFTVVDDNTEAGLPSFIAKHLSQPDFEFAKQFERGRYKQDRGFIEQIANQIINPLSDSFVLLDNQRLGFEVCRTRIQEAVTNRPVEKVVLIIEGPPGSGKSVLAAKLWADVATSHWVLGGNVVLTTTSASQGSNWEHIFEMVANSAAGAGVVKRANQYTPATIQWFSQYNKDHPDAPMTADSWETNIPIVRAALGQLRCPDDDFLVSIVDEAHGLINPEKPIARPGVSGWPITAGPQAYHIIRASRVTVFLTDSAQSFRDNETTTTEDIIRCAKLLGAAVAEPISLADNQFRCGGSKEYIDWMEGVLNLRAAPNPELWRKSADNPAGKMIFDIVDRPDILEDRLRDRIKEGHTARIVAPYARPWATRGEKKPHDLPTDKMDFAIPITVDGNTKTWGKIWNFVEADADYSLYVQAPEGTRMYTDPLCEVGCPYTVRGFDYGYLGVLWCNDLTWRKDRWVFDLDHVHEGAWKQTLAAVRREVAGKVAGDLAQVELLRRLKVAYRILLSRAIKGLYVWFEDDETRNHVTSKLPL